MKKNPIYSFCILTSALFCTVYTCLKTVFKSVTGTITKSWCDDEIIRWKNRLIKLIQIKCRVVNPNKISPQPGKATIIMCNHTSLFDIPLSFHAFPNQSIRMLAKRELFKIPFFGKAMVSAGFPRITRHDRRQAIQDLELVENMLRSGTVMWIAPEGTRSKNGKLGLFKKGAFITAIKTHSIIIPIGIRGAERILPAKSMRLNLGENIEIHIGNPIDASQYQLGDKEVLIEKVRNEMLILVGEKT